MSGDLLRPLTADGSSTPTPRRHPASLTRDLDLDHAAVLDLLARAWTLGSAKRAGREVPLLRGRGVALLFERASHGIRTAFEQAAHDQGAHLTYLGPERPRIGTWESVADDARALGSAFDAIAFHGHEHTTLEQLADWAGVPVWNGRSNLWQPIQVLADLLTMSDHTDLPFQQITVCHLGDGRRSVARSLLVLGALLGMDVRIAAPGGLGPPLDVLAAAQRRAAASGARLTVTDDVAAAVRGADFIYGHGWVDRDGSTRRWAARVPKLLPFRVTEDLLEATGNPATAFLHCLPAEHGPGSFGGPRSLADEQVANRVHLTKALLLAGLAADEPPLGRLEPAAPTGSVRSPGRRTDDVRPG